MKILAGDWPRDKYVRIERGPTGEPKHLLMPKGSSSEEDEKIPCDQIQILNEKKKTFFSTAFARVFPGVSMKFREPGIDASGFSAVINVSTATLRRSLQPERGEKEKGLLCAITFKDGRGVLLECEPKDIGELLRGIKKYSDDVIRALARLGR
ncbi:MAG: hypothetical protein O7D31_10300 [Alphaproteobacteria bacterium]|nr:hypothetical protein [Alphaproteobacteria bacterium]